MPLFHHSQEFKKVSMLLKHFKVMEQLLVCNRIDKGDGGKDEGGGSWLLPPQVLFTLPAVAAHTFHESAATAAHDILPASMPPPDVVFESVISSGIGSAW